MERYDPVKYTYTVSIAWREENHDKTWSTFEDVYSDFEKAMDFFRQQLHSGYTKVFKFRILENGEEVVFEF